MQPKQSKTMATITLSYDEKNATARKKEESPYNPEFVRKIEDAKKEVRDGKVFSYEEVKKMLNWD